MVTAMTSLTAAIASTSSKRIDPAHPGLIAPQDRLEEDGDVFQVRLPAQVGSDGFEIGPLRARAWTHKCAAKGGSKQA